MTTCQITRQICYHFINHHWVDFFSPSSEAFHPHRFYECQFARGPRIAYVYVSTIRRWWSFGKMCIEWGCCLPAFSCYERHENAPTCSCTRNPFCNSRAESIGGKVHFGDQVFELLILARAKNRLNALRWVCVCVCSVGPTPTKQRLTWIDGFH